MKYILIALLFCSCGSSGEVEPTYFDSHFLGATYYPGKPHICDTITLKDSTWYEFASPEDSLRGIYTTVAIISHADTFPGPAKPLNIMDSAIKYGWQVRWGPPTLAYHVSEGEYRIHKSDTTKPLKDSGIIDLGDTEWHCLVAHCTEDGCFTCDYKGHYFPYRIYNDSIRKWFVKMDANDSLFYYRQPDDTSYYIWDGSHKDSIGEYVFKYEGGGSSSFYLKYNGSDTIKIINQVWRPSPSNPKPFQN